MASSVGSAFARKLNRAAAEAQRAGPAALGAASLAMKRGIEAEIRRVVPSGRLRNVGRKGSKVGVRYDIRNGSQRSTSLIKATGQLQLVERDTRAHTIAPRSRGRGRARRAGGGLVLPDGGVRRSVRHPGTKGKAPFAKGVDRTLPEAKRVMRSSMVDAVRRGIRG